MPSSIRAAEDNAIFWTKEQDQQKTNGAPTFVWIVCTRTLPGSPAVPSPRATASPGKCDHFSLSCPAACTACYS